jgi:hypothetical protein
VCIVGSGLGFDTPDLGGRCVTLGTAARGVGVGCVVGVCSWRERPLRGREVARTRAACCDGLTWCGACVAAVAAGDGFWMGQRQNKFKSSIDFGLLVSYA